MRIVKAEKTYQVAPIAAKSTAGNAKIWIKFHCARKVHFMACLGGQWEEVVTIAYPSQSTAIVRVKPASLDHYLIASSTATGYGYHKQSAASLECFRKLGWNFRGLSGGEGESATLDMVLSWIEYTFGPVVESVMIVGV